MEEEISLLKENSPLLSTKPKVEKEDNVIVRAIILSSISCCLLIVLSILVGGLLIIPRKSK